MSRIKNSSGNEFAINKNWLRKSFSKAAPSYNKVAVLQKEVASRLLERLDYVKLQPETILDVGSGTGFCSNQLEQRFKKVPVISLDMAFGMLQYARSQRSWFNKLRSQQQFICADAEALPIADNTVDLVISSLALQWCFNLQDTFADLRRAMKSDGLLMFATMGPDTLKELRASWATADSLVHVSGFFDMHDIGDALIRAGFSNPVMDVETITLTYADVKGLMNDLKSLGSRNALQGRSQGLTGKNKIKVMFESYEKFRNDEGLPATYEIVYGHAWAPGKEYSPFRQDNDFPIPVRQQALKK